MRLPRHLAAMGLITSVACAFPPGARAAAPRPIERPPISSADSGAGGVAAAPFVSSGAAPVLSRFDARLSMQGRVEERLELVPAGAAFELAIPSFPEDDWSIQVENQHEAQHGEMTVEGLARALEANPPAGLAAHGSLRALSVRIDGEEVIPRERVFTPGDGGWIGARVVQVPKGAREVVIRYTIEAVTDDQGAAYVRYDPAGLCTFAKKGAVEVAVDVGDLPATHVDVSTRPVPAKGCSVPRAPPSFRFDGGRVKVRSAGEVPPVVRVRAAVGQCVLSEGKVQGTFFACLGVRHEDPTLERWFQEAPPHAYDARSLSLARNWLFAVTGRRFESPELRAFFEAKPWYREDATWTDARLGPEERRAVQVLRKAEQRHARPQ